MDTHITPHTPPDIRLLRLRDVVARVGLARATIYQLAARGQFPRPVRLAPHTVAWRSDDLDAWIASRERTRSAETSR